VVYHLAASKKVACLIDPELDLRTNAMGTLRVLECARRACVQRFIHVSTGSVFGERRGLITEKRSFMPVSHYGISKLAGELYVRLYQEMYHMPTVILRPFHVYGPRQESADDKGGVVAIFVRRILEGKQPIIYGDGQQTRTFTFVNDVVDALMLALTDDRMLGEDYNVSSGRRWTVLHLAEWFIARAEKQMIPEFYPAVPGDIKDFHVDNTKVRQLGLSFTETTIGLERTFLWYMKHRPLGEHLV
jgi:UDP-glucose 4-epimerase